MFIVKHIKNSSEDCVELKNSDNSSCAKINLKLGGSLLELQLQNKTLIASKDVLPYHHSFASAILFPFTNRIEKGRYIFNNTTYKLDCNKTDEDNAIHGLVYNKAFEVIDEETSSDKAIVSITYVEDKKVEGFPFQYSITLKYELTNTALSLDVEIKNLDSNSFPFNLGWHPYFSTTNLFNSTLLLNSYKKIVVNNNMIPVNEEEINWEKPIKIENKTFDDCYVLNNNSITFKTPEYQFEFSFSTTENYLQLYTPLNRKTIAIEPQTAPANSFNNGKGIQVLKPNESYNLNWNINLKP